MYICQYNFGRGLLVYSNNIWQLNHIKEIRYIATELWQGNLEDYINRIYQGPRFKNDREILHQLALGVDHLHENFISHGHIKPTNILVFVPSAADAGFKTFPLMKLADFGISNNFKADEEDDKNTHMRYPIGTKGWSAPEIYSVDFKVDIWALGCIFAYILSEGNKHPFGDDAEERVLWIKNKRPMFLV